MQCLCLTISGKATLLSQSPVKGRNKRESTVLHNGFLCMSSRVHTSLVRSYIPFLLCKHRHSSSRTGPGRPGCHTMKGKKESGMKNECEEVRNTAKDTSTSRFSVSNNKQPPGEALCQELPHRLLLSIYLKLLQHFWQIHFHCMTSDHLTAATNVPKQTLQERRL